MEKAEDLSVLMTVYSGEKPDFLEQAIKSLLIQTHKAKEIIIIEDGSLTSELNKVLAKYQSEISLYKNYGKQGRTYALNMGLSKINTKYYAIMDSDDISIPQRFEIQMNAIKDRTNLCVIGGQIEEFDSFSGKVIGKRCVPQDMESIYKYSKFRSPVNNVTAILNLSDVIEVGGYNPILGFEDYDLWIRLLEQNKIIVNLNQTLVKVRTNKELYKRRTGFKYFASEFLFQRKLLRQQYINRLLFFRNIFIRGGLKLLPPTLLSLLYKKCTRTK